VYKKILLKTELPPTQASILDYLYQEKQAKASEIARIIKKSRAMVYKDLEELVTMNIVEKTDRPNQVSIFRAGHPSHLEKLLDRRENQVKKDRELLNNYLPDLISGYNLIHNRPGIKFYEGRDGIKKILYDSLNCKSEIYTISDTRSVRENLKEINEEYVKKRKKLGIKKKLIVPASARDEFKETKTEFTEIRFLDEKYYNFNTGMQIYDNKVSFQTLSPENMIGVLIADKNIYTMHKMLFEYIWNSLAK